VLDVAAFSFYFAAGERFAPSCALSKRIDLSAGRTFPCATRHAVSARRRSRPLRDRGIERATSGWLRRRRDGRRVNLGAAYCETVLVRMTAMSPPRTPGKLVLAAGPRSVQQVAHALRLDRDASVIALGPACILDHGGAHRVGDATTEQGQQHFG
jgi:hypothetical protein